MNQFAFFMDLFIVLSLMYITAARMVANRSTSLSASRQPSRKRPKACTDPAQAPRHTLLISIQESRKAGTPMYVSITTQERTVLVRTVLILRKPLHDV